MAAARLTNYQPVSQKPILAKRAITFCFCLHQYAHPLWRDLHLTFVPRNDTSKVYVILDFDMATIININADQQTTSNALDDLHHISPTICPGRNNAVGTFIFGCQSDPRSGDHIIGAGGKRLRPLLTLSAARIAGYRGNHHITMAAAVEFMHTATLLHDDVVDDSDLRRGKPTARKIWGNPTSVLVGDFCWVRPSG